MRMREITLIFPGKEMMSLKEDQTLLLVWRGWRRQFLNALKTSGRKGAQEMQVSNVKGWKG